MESTPIAQIPEELYEQAEKMEELLVWKKVEESHKRAHFTKLSKIGNFWSNINNNN